MSVQRFDSRGKGRVSRDVAGGADRAFEEAPTAVSEEELAEFLAADLDPVPADPVFRERLREELWDFVERGLAIRPRDH